MQIVLPTTLVLLLASAISSNAAAFPRTTQGISGAVHRMHRIALKNSGGLARDLRIAFNGVLARREPDQSSHRVYCTTPQSNSTTSTTSSRHGPSSSAHSSKTSSASLPGSTLPPSPWKLAESHQGQDFFSGWDFFTGADPTHGTVQYVDQGTGQASNLSYVNSRGNAIMAVDTTPTVQNGRQSIRITTRSTYNGGLFILDAIHMPTGCGTWPAFWTNGPNWPAGGEIDIVEGIHDNTNNQATIHTNPGCTIPSTSATALHMTGSVVGGTDCAAADTGNQGCGVRSNQANSFGAPFNSNGGGVYAMKWDASGISVFFFPRGSEPADITAGVPQPSNWGAPLANWPAASCNPFQFFYSHSVIFDTTLCGDWAGSAWSSSGSPGQDQSCAQLTGYSTCDAFVLASGSSFAQAYWEVASVKVYQNQS